MAWSQREQRRSLHKHVTNTSQPICQHAYLKDDRFCLQSRNILRKFLSLLAILNPSLSGPAPRLVPRQRTLSTSFSSLSMCEFSSSKRRVKYSCMHQLPALVIGCHQLSSACHKGRLTLTEPSWTDELRASTSITIKGGSRLLVLMCLSTSFMCSRHASSFSVDSCQHHQTVQLEPYHLQNTPELAPKGCDPCCRGLCTLARPLQACIHQVQPSPDTPASVPA
jgi:hypothetical protein